MPLPKPIGRQREVLYLDAKGHVAVLGTAGSGKTTLAILRSAYLADCNTPHAGPTLLVTFNQALVTFLQQIAAPELAEVQVETYHVFARGYLNARGLMSRDAICSPDQRQELIEAACATVTQRARYKPGVTTTVCDDAIRLSYQLGHRDQEAAIDTIVAAFEINRADALHIIAVRQEYETIRSAAGRMYDWDDIALAVDEALSSDTDARKYRHIVIDEGQDFSPVMIRSLTKAVPPEGSVTFFGDVAQQIYGRRFSWRSAGLLITKPWLFEENYRNTKQIAELAIALTKEPYYLGIPDLVAPRSARAAGPLPALVEFADETREIEQVLEWAVASGRGAATAVLFRDREQERLLTSLISKRDFVRLHRKMDSWSSEAGLYIGSYHSAKGLEFEAVYIPLLSAARMPDPDEMLRNGQKEAEAAEAKLIYVGITRARGTLVLTYSGRRTKLLPDNLKLYQFSKR